MRCSHTYLELIRPFHAPRRIAASPQQFQILYVKRRGSGPALHQAARHGLLEGNPGRRRLAPHNKPETHESEGRQGKRVCLTLTPLELQSRFGDNPLKIQVSCPQLSPKRNCSPKRVKCTRTKRVEWHGMLCPSAIIHQVEPTWPISIPQKNDCEGVCSPPSRVGGRAGGRGCDTYRDRFNDVARGKHKKRKEEKKR